jgi:hypothetical protein
MSERGEKETKPMFVKEEGLLGMGKKIFKKIIERMDEERSQEMKEVCVM